MTYELFYSMEWSTEAAYKRGSDERPENSFSPALGYVFRSIRISLYSSVLHPACKATFVPSKTKPRNKSHIKGRFLCPTAHKVRLPKVTGISVKFVDAKMIQSAPYHHVHQCDNIIHVHNEHSDIFRPPPRTSVLIEQTRKPNK